MLVEPIGLSQASFEEVAVYRPFEGPLGNGESYFQGKGTDGLGRVQDIKKFEHANTQGGAVLKYISKPLLVAKAFLFGEGKSPQPCHGLLLFMASFVADGQLVAPFRAASRQDLAAIVGLHA